MKKTEIVELIMSAPHMTATDIAETLGVEIATVYWAAKVCGVKPRSGSTAVCASERRRVESLARAGISDDEIARRLERSPCTIGKIRRQFGIYRPGYPRPESDLSRHDRIRIVRLHLIDGYSYGDVAYEFGVTRNVVAGCVYRCRRDNWDLNERVKREVESV